MTNVFSKSRFNYKNNPTFTAWLVCLSGGLLFFYEFIQLNIFGSLNAPIMRAFHLSAHQLGNLSSTYFYANAFFIFVAGNLLDRYSTRKLILFSMLLCTLGTLGFSVSGNVWEAGVARFVVGIGGAFCFLSGVRLASRWFPPKKMALMTGILVTMAFVGGYLAQTPMACLIQAVGWRNAMLFNGLLGILVTLWIFLIVQDYPKGAEEKAQQEKTQLKNIGLATCIVRVLSNSQNWKAAFYTALMNLPIFLLGALWGSLYLVQIHHFTTARATTITGMLYFGTMFGSPIMGWFSDRIQSRRIPMLLGAVLSLALMMLVVYVPSLSFDSLWIIFLLLGFITSSQVIGYPVAAESNPAIITATAVSIVSTIVIFGGAVMQPVSGWLLDRYWTGGMSHGVHSYSLSAYQHAMVLMLVSFIIAFVLAFLIRETRCKPYHEKNKTDQVC
jgi:MFS family permease